MQKNPKLYLLLAPLILVVLLTTILVSTYRFPADTAPRNGARKKSTSAHTLQQLGRAYSELENNRYQTAEELLEGILRNDPRNPMALRLLGRLYYDTARYEDAEKIYRLLIERNTFDASAHNNLGQVLFRRGSAQDALQELLISLNLNPESPLVHLNLSGIYAELGDMEKARHHFQEAHRQLRINNSRKTDRILP